MTLLSRLSVLDLTPISEGHTAAETLQHTLELAKQADGWGYTRYWLSEHHNTSMLASASPELLLGQIAAVTQALKVGTGGVMLPNHAALKVAENFRLLEALYPGRIDLGLGRAPGTDLRTALALRRSAELLQVEDFPQQLTELLAYLQDQAVNGIQAIPLGVPAPAVWLLGSSTFSAKLAAERGLPFAFAHHIQPEPAAAALALYREQFQPSALLTQPMALAAVSVLCAPTQAEAEELALSADLTWLRFRQYQGRPGPVPSLATVKAQIFTAAEQAVMQASRQRMRVGSPQQLRQQLEQLAAELGVEELMLTTLVHGQAERLRSYQLLAEAFGLQSEPA